MLTKETRVPETLLRIDKVELENYRCFPRLKVHFHPKLTVLAARNGLGKTAVLDAVAVALGPYVGAFDEAMGKHFAASDARLARVSDTHVSEYEYQFPVTLAAEGIIDGNREIWNRSLSGKRGHTTYADARSLDTFGRRLQDSVRNAAGKKASRLQSPVEIVPTLLPLVSYYGTGRLWGEMRLTKGKRAQVRTSRTAGYTDCLTSSSRYRAFADWFERLSRSAFDERDNPDKLPLITDALLAIRSAVDLVLAPTGWRNIAYKDSEAGIVALHPEHGTLPVAWLSDGIRNMIGLTADIAHRAVRLNPHLGAESVTSTPGIVLIDEIEMHLHPEWQQVVVGALCEAFPKIQFIITTHSPQVISSIHRESLRILMKSEETWEFIAPGFQTRGVESSEVLSRIMGVDPIPAVPEARMLADYRALIETGDAESPAALKLRELLLAHFGSDHPVVLDCDRLLRFQRFRRPSQHERKG